MTDFEKIDDADGSNAVNLLTRPQLQREFQPRFVAAVAVIFISNLLIDVPLGAVFLRGPESEIVAIAMMSTVIARACLLATWLAWGTSRVIWRLIVVSLSLLFSCLIISRAPQEVFGPDGGSYYSMLLVAHVTEALILATPRLFGVRLVSLREIDSRGRLLDQAAARKTRQFTMLDIFMWTFTAACLAGIVRLFGFRAAAGEVFIILFELLILVGITSVAALLSLWAVLWRGNNVWRIALSLFGFPLLCTVITSAITYAPHAPDREFAYIFLFVFLGMLIYMCPLFVLRHWNDRLIRAR